MTVDTKALRELLVKATPGPWHLSIHTHGGDPLACDASNSIVGKMRSHEDTECIVAAINALPELLDECERLRAALVHARDLIEEIQAAASDNPRETVRDVVDSACFILAYDALARRTKEQP
jgi:hypothetical protein